MKNVPILVTGLLCLPALTWPSQLVQVASFNNQRKVVTMRTDGTVRLVKKLGIAPCILGQTWGFDANHIWAINGCRAIFSVGKSYRDLPPTWVADSFKSEDGTVVLTIQPNGRALWSQRFPNRMRVLQSGYYDRHNLVFGTQRMMVMRTANGIQLVPMTSRRKPIRFIKWMGLKTKAG